MGKIFLKLLDTHFPENHPLRKCVNRNCVKVAYRCTPNIKAIIQSHNAKTLREHNKKPATTNNKNTTCNCRIKNKCPLGGNCKTGPVVYKASIVSGSEVKATYIGSTQAFKERHNNHKASFRDESLKHATALSKYVWEQDLGPEPNISWSILRRCGLYRKGGRYCDLCLTEKVLIAKAMKDPTSLNKRAELTLRCAHKAKFKLAK